MQGHPVRLTRGCRRMQPAAYLQPCAKLSNSMSMQAEPTTTAVPWVRVKVKDTCDRGAGESVDRESTAFTPVLVRARQPILT